jgi:glycosyltransferase involved in cell wall biosynthesis
MKISVIVPIYKVEPYLRKCVDSILAQTHRDLEVILVDDQSPDGCPAICDWYASNDPRIKVIHKKNGGLSDARNAGLEIATGDWLSFIDSDDWIEPQMYEKLLRNAEQTDAQISVGAVIAEAETENGYVQLNPKEDLVISITSMQRMEAIRYFLGNSWSAWDKIYRREVFEGIRYPVGEINEDEAIALYLLDRCERVVYTSEPFYHYIRRPESITTSPFSVKKLDWYRHSKANLEWIRKHYPALEEQALLRHRSCLLWSLTEMATSEQPFQKERRMLKAELQKNRRAFGKLPANRSVKLRCFLLTYLPFGLYRAFARRRRSS